MKEQVSVDYVVTKTSHPEELAYMPKSVFERLKRLEENVKKEIEQAKKEITRINTFIGNGCSSPYHFQRIEHFEYKIKLLESLYK